VSSGLNSIIRNILWIGQIPSLDFFDYANIRERSMSPLSLSELVIVKHEDFNRQFVDGAGIIHTFLFLKSQQSTDQPIYCDFTPNKGRQRAFSPTLHIYGITR
jgi:hypothetical protein